jgi:small conductance mechanosensitive channel
MNIQAALVDVAGKLIGWGYGLILLVPNFIAAGIVMLVAWGLSVLAKSLTLRAMSRAHSQVLLGNLLSTIAQILIIVIGLFVALGIMKLDKTVTSLLAGAGVIGLALAFAFQDVASNFLAGVLMALRRPFSPGHIIETNDFLGTVEELNLRSTHLRTPEGQVVILPNAEVFSKPITNFSMSGMRRVDLRCDVSYNDDLEKAEDVALEAI